MIMFSRVWLAGCHIFTRVEKEESKILSESSAFQRFLTVWLKALVNQIKINQYLAQNFLLPCKRMLLKVVNVLCPPTKHKIQWKQCYLYINYLISVWLHLKDLTWTFATIIFKLYF